MELDYEAAKAEGFYTPEAYTLFKQLEFKNMLSRFDSNQVPDGSALEKLFKECESAEAFVVRVNEIIASEKTAEGRCSTDGAEKGDSRRSVTGTVPVGIWLALEDKRLLGVAICAATKDGTENTFFYLLKKEEEGQQTLFALLEGYTDEAQKEEARVKEAVFRLSETVNLSAFDIKKLYGYLEKKDTNRYFDILIGAYLLNPLKNDYDMEAIANEHLGMMIPGYGEVFGKLSISQAREQKPEEFGRYICYGAYVARNSCKVLQQKLTETGMDKLMEEIEMPLSLVLYDMEKEGVEVRRKELRNYGDALIARIDELEQSIHEQAGVDFNINSPKQLGEVLFETMKLPGGKKTKTGYSTAADVLEKLAPEHPIIKDILEYRGLTKLKSTYADGLAVYIGEDKRIHTNFNQTITATGRISSTEPNLQNIPMRMELGRQIRKVFVPREGYLFMDADYSQIELRVLAHMSGDEQLIEAYHMDQDIHRITASKVFHTPFEEVTDLQRRNAKAVNFGIVYGISSFGLSQDLSISKKEASEYIEQYFATYPKVKEFLDRLVSEAKDKGYVTTMFGRRRPVPELSSSNFMQRSFGERIAMNSPIQGTAADIIKIAMIRVWRGLAEAGLKSRLILQVHDELLIETVKEEEAQVRKILEENMKTAAKLKVSLEVDLHTGDNWYEAK